MPTSELGEKIRVLRQSLRESQEEFGQRFSVEQATVSRWENGEPVKRALRSGIASLADQHEAEFFHDVPVREVKRIAGDLRKLIDAATETLERLERSIEKL
jgi:transcriptional regulator with XRE-family HTH domain